MFQSLFWWISCWDSNDRYDCWEGYGFNPCSGGLAVGTPCCSKLLCGFLVSILVLVD